MIKILSMPEPDNIEGLRHELMAWLTRWDRVYNLDAVNYYPEYRNFLNKYGYTV
jgi:hypothetical protein